MSQLVADGLGTVAAWWDHHAVPVFVACLFGLVVADRFLAGPRGRAAVDPQNDDYADPPDDLDP